MKLVITVFIFICVDNPLVIILFYVSFPKYIFIIENFIF